MKNSISKAFIVFSFVFISCNKNLYNKPFYYIDPYNEWELSLIINKDSSFVLEDKYGCNKFKYKGNWTKLSFGEFSCFILNDTNKVLYDSVFRRYHYNNGESILKFDDNSILFKFIKHDTVCYTPANKLLFRGLAFFRPNLFSNFNLPKERSKMIRSDFINKFGRKKFIEIFGNGKSMEQAMKNIENVNCPHR